MEGDVFGVYSDSLILRFRRLVNQVQVISNCDSAPTCDLQDLVLNVAVERDVCEGRRGLKSDQGLWVKFPFVVPVTENELPSLVGSGIDDHE